MNRQVLIDKVITKIKQLPDLKIKEVNDFVDFLLSKTDDKIIREGVQELTSESEGVDFPDDEDDLSIVNEAEESYDKTPAFLLTKDKVNKTINALPDSFTIDELMDKLIFMEKVEAGFQQSEEGKVISNDDVKVMIDKWSK